MPRLYCEKHARDRETAMIGSEDVYRQADEVVLVVTGKLISGPWHCDRCNVQLRKGDPASLMSAFPSHCRDDLYDYSFRYERQYFAINKSLTATAYGAKWPDGSIRNRRKTKR
jgi:hypothetical protein